MYIGQWLIISGPGGDDSSSGGGSDMGAAQNTLDVWTGTGKGWKGEALELDGLDTAHMAHLIGFESVKELLIHLHEHSLGQWPPWRLIFVKDSLGLKGHPGG